MFDWIADHLFIVIIGSFAIFSTGYALWLRHQMATSKSRFALAVVGVLAAYAMAVLKLVTDPPHAISVSIPFIELFGLVPRPSTVDSLFLVLLAVGVSLIAIRYVYKFATTVIMNWEGPVTLSVSELVKQGQDNNIALLAFAEARRLMSFKPDPIVHDLAINWQQKLPEPPSTPLWHELARDLFQAAFSETEIAANGWRDRHQAWVGRIYVGDSLSEPFPLFLLVCDEEPSRAELQKKIKSLLSDGALSPELKIFVVFHSDLSKCKRIMKVLDFELELWPRRTLLREGLRLANYARSLINRFEREPLGGTSATLKDTFVEAHVKVRNSTERKLLPEVMSEWISDSSRRHLAITGEYGQGKSTAMLNFCVKWARRYLTDGALDEPVPLLIELRGQSPAEVDPVGFLAPWASRYGLQSRQLYNLIKAGEAIVIFEGFDELRNAGRAYDRHEHFNALWRMAFPGSKLVFTGRPNFFIDEKEKNRTLRADFLQGAAGNAFTQLWELDRLNEQEIEKVANGFGEVLGRSIISATKSHPPFQEIVSRPSMLPVVATIWSTIEQLQQKSQNVTSATLLELYLKAIYQRKTQEIESKRNAWDAALLA